MFQTMYNSDNMNVCYLARRALSSTTGNLGKNVVHVIRTYGVHNIASDSITISNLEDHEKQRIDQIQELLQIREDHHSLQAFEISEINDMLTYLCTY